MNKSNPEPTKQISDFDSDFYFDDIIKELGEAGFYSEDEELDFQAPLSNYRNTSINANRSQPVENELSKEIETISKTNSLLMEKIEYLNKKVKQLTVFALKQQQKDELSLKQVEEELLHLRHSHDDNIDKIYDVFQEKIREDSIKEKAFEELYSQLADYKNNFISNAQKPFINDILLFQDRLADDIRHCHSEDKKNISLVNLEMFQDEILEILTRYGVERMTISNPGDKFDPKKSHAVERFITKEKDQHLTIKKVLKVGFKFNDKIIRPEIVEIYKN